jgi:hypothetical protein
MMNVNSLLLDPNYNNNLNNNARNQIINKYKSDYGALSATINSFYNNSLPVVDVNMCAINDVTGYIYAICYLTYYVNITGTFDDGFGGTYTDTMDYQYMQLSLLKTGKYYGLTYYLCDVNNTDPYTHMTTKTDGSLLYLMKTINNNVYIDTLLLTNYTITQLYTSNPTNITAYDFISDTNNNLYISDNGTGTILKVTPNGVGSTFASFVYPSSKYGFNGGTTTYKGRPQGLAFDIAGNLYVSDNGTSFNNGNASYTYYSTPYIYKIPAGSSPGQTYNPDDAITTPNTYAFSNPGQGNE